MSNKKILLEILKELKRQNEVLKKLDMCISQSKFGESPYINTKVFSKY